MMHEAINFTNTSLRPGVIMAEGESNAETAESDGSCLHSESQSDVALFVQLHNNLSQA